jgi:hypothetical protein
MNWCPVSSCSVEKVGLPAGSEQAYQGAKGWWQQFFAALEQVLARID